MISREQLSHIRYLLLGALLVYLPFSAWLVSASGHTGFTLVRDVLVLGVFCISVYQFNQQKTARLNYLLFPATLLVVLMICSWYWREASPEQWFRGLRFMLLPILVFLSLQLSPLQPQEWRDLRTLVLVGLAIILITVALEFTGHPIPMTTEVSGGQGALIETHQVGMINIARLQGILAGPNALGLYLLAALAWVVSGRKRAFWLAVVCALGIGLSFSRASLLALLLFGIMSYLIWAWQQPRRGLLLGFAVAGLMLLCGLGIAVYQQPAWRDIVTHYDSSSQRVEQYQRILTTSHEIGLFGRGAGTAGPASQYRLDGGPNRWTENSYLDFYEEYGIFGLVLLLAILSYALVRAWKSSPFAAAAATSFLVAGLFINMGTGQVGLFLSLIYLSYYSRPR